MGRTFFSTARPEHKDLPKLVHVFATPIGTLVLAMRPPEPTERGYAIGYDATILQMVDEILEDWHPSDEGPGWLVTSYSSRVTPGNHATDPNAIDARISPKDPYYEVTILAAFERVTRDERAVDPRAHVALADAARHVEAAKRVYEVLDRWPDNKTAAFDCGEDYDPSEDLIEKSSACVTAVLEGTLPDCLIPSTAHGDS
jgi:hypothetical protein